MTTCACTESGGRVISLCGAHSQVVHESSGRAARNALESAKLAIGKLFVPELEYIDMPTLCINGVLERVLKTINALKDKL